MIIGVFKEQENENRVALLPDHVTQLKKWGVEVCIEKGAGISSFADDDQYQTAGAELTDASSILSKANLLLSVSIPRQDILQGIRGTHYLIGTFNPVFNREAIEIMQKSGATAFSLDFVPRTTRAQAMDVLSSMATIAGYKAVLEAASRLPRFFPMFMSAAGTIKPAKVLILGAGVAGLQAIAIARKLGAVVEVFDVRSAVKEEVKSLGGKFIEVEGAREDAAAGGYAVEQSEEFIRKQRQLIHDHASNADVVICTAQVFGKKAPLLLTKATVEAMRPGSVVIDLAASTGGNCELTQNGQSIWHKQVLIIGKSNYPSEMPFDASKMYGNNLLNFLKLIVNKDGQLQIPFDDDIIQATCMVKENKIVNERYLQLIK
ncbi:MAG: Re/Si-specific NAD(P)(+) transhydrogenase subunit alpha [Bacteroidales bacterium]|nr:Re/Si-specific NAD(P)(+) transhydrogenase subunit alpha [Bacteroidales bacterium]HOK99615.1 Re/Si-specific NAD(P)(+) transhydrogenase subunit alpha [Bacteroidales bacterium]HPO66447.1 Re/Si-specific NAD(P)(+) transhydrogenase subunit alpha [Bacteroidales bacterium]